MADIDSTSTAEPQQQQQQVEEGKPEEISDFAPQMNGSENYDALPEGESYAEEGATEGLGEYNGGEPGEEFTHEELTLDENGVPIDFHPQVVPQQQKLDVHLAVIEEQFRRGFEERYAQPSLASQRQIWEDPAETIRANKIFREVSRGLGGEWRPVFDELMTPFTREVTELELGKISMSSPIIQGYKALAAWKEISGRNYSLMKLVEVLRNQNFDDIADAAIYIIDNDDLPNSKDKPAKPVQRRKSDLTPKNKNPAILDDRRMLLIAKKIEGNYESLAKELGIPDEEISEIKESEGATYQGSFKVLWSWRDVRHPQPPAPRPEEEGPSDIDVLKAALEKVDLKAVADKIEEMK